MTARLVVNKLTSRIVENETCWPGCALVSNCVPAGNRNEAVLASTEKLNTSSAARGGWATNLKSKRNLLRCRGGTRLKLETADSVNQSKNSMSVLQRSTSFC